MREGLRYVTASLALGVIAVWASENLFWSAPPDDLTPAGWLMTWIAYSGASACALSAVVWAGIGGWRGVFLGGAILGFVVEGVLVGTMYDAFPFQLVWTPLAWHALITALAVGGVARMAGRWPWSWLVGAQLGTGMLAGFFALYWPLERAAMPGALATAGYIAGVGLVLPVAHAVLDRLGHVPRPPGWVLLVVPGLAVVIWVAQTVAVPDPLRLACPLLIGATVWIMRRLGRGATVSFGAPASLTRRASGLLVPAGMLAVALPGWASLGAYPANIAIAAFTVPVSLGLWVWCLWQALRAGR